MQFAKRCFALIYFDRRQRRQRQWSLVFLECITIPDFLKYSLVSCSVTDLWCYAAESIRRWIFQPLSPNILEMLGQQEVISFLPSMVWLPATLVASHPRPTGYPLCCMCLVVDSPLCHPSFDTKGSWLLPIWLRYTAWLQYLLGSNMSFIPALCTAQPSLRTLLSSFREPLVFWSPKEVLSDPPRQVSVISWTEQKCLVWVESPPFWGWRASSVHQIEYSWAIVVDVVADANWPWCWNCPCLINDISYLLQCGFFLVWRLAYWRHLFSCCPQNADSCPSRYGSLSDTPRPFPSVLSIFRIFSLLKNLLGTCIDLQWMLLFSWYSFSLPSCFYPQSWVLSAFYGGIGVNGKFPSRSSVWLRKNLLVSVLISLRILIISLSRLLCPFIGLTFLPSTTPNLSSAIS